MPQESTKQDARGMILDAAERQLAHYGFTKMTMSDLAEEAGVGVGSIYLHFAGKAEVAIAVVERSNQRVVEQLEAESRKTNAVDARLKSILQMRILLRYEIVRHRSHQMDEVRALIRQQKVIRPAFMRWFEVETHIIAEVLLEGKRLGVFDFEDAAITAQTILWSMDVLMPRNLRPHDFESPDEVRTKTERLADFALRSLRPLDKH